MARWFNKINRLFSNERQGRFELFADCEQIQKLDLASPISVSGQRCAIISLDGHSLTVHADVPMPSSGSDVHVMQVVYHFAAESVANQLSLFWSPIWERDAPDISFLDDPDPCLEFPRLRNAARFPPIAIKLDDVSLWMAAIKGLKPSSARGIDAISSQELKMLPTSLVSLLAQVLTQQDAFGSCYMVGLTCPLSKVSHLPEGHQTRPITILSQTYRVWSSVICKQIAEHFVTVLPKEITGLLPGRGSSDASYSMQFSIECSRAYHLGKSGVTPDLRKCFNCLRWRFVYALMLLLGIPGEILTAWIVSLSRLRRVWIISGQVFDAGPTSTGLPEGDSWSVMAMLAVNTFWILAMKAANTTQYPHSSLMLSVC